MKTKIFVAVLILVMILSACNDTNSPDAIAVEGVTWELIYHGKSTVMEGVMITATFTDGQINGSAGCNSYFGSYEMDGEKISIGQIGMTEMFCMDPEGVMDLEGKYLDWLMDAYTVRIADGQLMIFRSAGEALTFVPQE